jgi:hypothetical protein
VFHLIIIWLIDSYCPAGTRSAASQSSGFRDPLPAEFLLRVQLVLINCETCSIAQKSPTPSSVSGSHLIRQLADDAGYWVVYHEDVDKVCLLDWWHAVERQGISGNDEHWRLLVSGLLAVSSLLEVKLQDVNIHQLTVTGIDAARARPDCMSGHRFSDTRVANLYGQSFAPEPHDGTNSNDDSG